MTEEPTYIGLFSGLRAKNEINQLLDELYGDPEPAPSSEAPPRATYATPYRYPVPNAFDELGGRFARLDLALEPDYAR